MIRADRSRFKRLVIAVLLAAAACIPVFAGLPGGQTALAQSTELQSKRFVFFPGREDLRAQPAQPHEYTLRGSAKIAEDNGGDIVVRLTQDGMRSQAGAVWANSKQYLSNGFETTFDVQITNQDLNEPTADGFTFVIHNDPQYDPSLPGAVGEQGCGLGYQGIGKSIAIKFDTFRNPPYCNFNEPSTPHISVLHSGDMMSSIRTVTEMPNQINIADGQPHTIKISYSVAINSYASDWLRLTLDGEPVFAFAIDLSAYLGYSNMAWIGLTSGTGIYHANHDFRNWYIANPGLACDLTYDFTSPGNEGHDFSNTLDYQWAIYPSEITPDSTEGWGSLVPSFAHESYLKIHRGIYGPNSYSEAGFLLEKDGLDPHLLARVNDGQPIEALRIRYTLVPDDANELLTISFTLGQAEQEDPTPISRSMQFDPSASAIDPITAEHTEMIEVFPRAHKPSGLLLEMHYPNGDYQIRLKAISLCVHDEAPPRPPVIPFGSRKACNDLLINIKQRYQPFGHSPEDEAVPISRQPEFQFPDDVSLEPYTAYNLGTVGYPASLSYDAAWAPAGTSPPILVPCAFWSGDTIYNPDSSTRPIIRFTAVGGTPEAREQLVLLNYAGYFSLGSPNWCFAGDNVFGSAWSGARETPANYGTGYNIPPPTYQCDPEGLTGESGGPCGTFVGSLQRAMGYFNTDSIAQAFEASSDSSSLGLHNLYYGAEDYEKSLPRNRHGDIDQVFVRLNNADPQQYRTRPISFRGVRVYSTIDEQGNYAYGLVQANGTPVNPIKCEPAVKALCDGKLPLGNCAAQVCTASPDSENCRMAQECANTASLLEQTPYGMDIPTSPDKQISGEFDPQDVWKAIKPGDIAITIVKSTNGSEIYTHVQSVIGWGPKVFRDTSYNTAVRYGYSIYPTYDSLPADQREQYIPYIIDRYQDPREGIQPRPFNYHIWHTATDFWVATP